MCCGSGNFILLRSLCCDLAETLPPRNVVPVDGSVCWFCDECSMSENGAETSKMVWRTSIMMELSEHSKDGCERSTSGSSDFGKPTSHNSRFIRFVGGDCNIVPEEARCCWGYERRNEVLDGRAQTVKRKKRSPGIHTDMMWTWVHHLIPWTNLGGIRCNNPEFGICILGRRRSHPHWIHVRGTTVDSNDCFDILLRLHEAISRTIPGCLL